MNVNLKMTDDEVVNSLAVGVGGDCILERPFVVVGGGGVVVDVVWRGL